MKANYNEILHLNDVLRTEHLILRKFSKYDAEDMYEYAKDARTAEFMTWEPHKSIEETKEVLFNFFLSKAGIYAIEYENKCIGCIDIRIIPEHEKATFGYVLNRKFWGRGFMTEALSAVLKVCFEKLELNRVESTHYVGNEGSGRVMEKCGMKKQGIGIREQKIRGIFRDLVHYAILKEDFF
ncbi:MAG: GNAT family N-acetyltransferase [Defluviitaleaceae bacterium]|nr:GNAT family N-acetyltransferase [Defluviitaleaceae bacterium]